MLQSFRALMTPTARRRPQAEQGNPKQPSPAETPDTVAESPLLTTPPATAIAELPNAKQQLSIPQLYQLLDTQLRVNMGAAVKCGICLSTLCEPIARTPCGHAYCRDCITASLHHSDRCPECNSKISKRSLQPANDFLVLLAAEYKTTLQDFGWTPSTYQADFTTLTQKPLSDPSNTSSSHGDAEENEEDRSKLIDRFQVAATWQDQALPHLAPTPLQIQENKAVVDANREACQEAGYTIVDPRVSQQLPNTQEILDTAREQQVADYELEESRKEDEEEGDDEENDTNNVPSQPYHTAPSQEATNHQEDSQNSSTLASSLRRASSEELTESEERRRVSFLMEDPTSTPAASGRPRSPSLELSPSHDAHETSLHLSLSPIPRRSSSMKPQDATSSVTPKARGGGGPTATKVDVATEPSAKSKAAVPESPIVQPAPKEAINDDKVVTTAPSALKEPSAVAAEGNSMEDNNHTSAEATTTTCATDTSAIAANTTGLMEDSFGAMHWVNQQKRNPSAGNNSLSLTLSGDDETDLSLSLTATYYDDPDMDYKQKRAALEAQEEGTAILAKTSSSLGQPDFPTNTEDSQEEENKEDSQATKIASGKNTKSQVDTESFSTEDNDDDSGMTACASQEQEDANAEEPSKFSMATDDMIPMGQETGGRKRNPTETNVERPHPPPRRRVQSEPTRGPDEATGCPHSIGEIVNIQSRTWSGINKPGGVARITKLNSDGSYNVSYVLGGRESNVDAAFVSKSEDDEGKRKRRETMDAALPTALLQALAAQGFDTTGSLTLEQAKAGTTPTTSEAPTTTSATTEEAPKNRKRKGALKDVSNRSKSTPVARKKTAPPTKPNSGGTRKRKSKDGATPTEASKQAKVVSTTTTPKMSTDASLKGRAESDSKSASSNSSKRKTAGKGPADSSCEAVLPNDEACALADARYQSQFEEALRNKVLNVVTSGLSNRDMDGLNALSSKMLNGDGTSKVDVSYQINYRCSAILTFFLPFKTHCSQNQVLGYIRFEDRLVHHATGPRPIQEEHNHAQKDSKGNTSRTRGYPDRLASVGAECLQGEQRRKYIARNGSVASCQDRCCCQVEECRVWSGPTSRFSNSWLRLTSAEPFHSFLWGLWCQSQRSSGVGRGSWGKNSTRSLGSFAGTWQIQGCTGVQRCRRRCHLAALLGWPSSKCDGKRYFVGTCSGCAMDLRIHYMCHGVTSDVLQPRKSTSQSIVGNWKSRTLNLAEKSCPTLLHFKYRSQ